jgi:hypothetical protein
VASSSAAEDNDEGTEGRHRDAAVAGAFGPRRAGVGDGFHPRVEVPGGFDAKGVGLEAKGYHAYSHHGLDPKLMSGQRKIEKYQLDHLARFIAKLDSLGLLGSTQVLFGSGMGDGSAHTNSDLPVLLAGGSHRHVTHQVLPEEKGKRVPLSNLYLRIAQQFGAEADRFGRSTGTLEVGA